MELEGKRAKKKCVLMDSEVLVLAEKLTVPLQANLRSLAYL